MRSIRSPDAAAGGLTLVELIIVVTFIVSVIAIAVPNLISSRMRANETEAISSLRSVGAAQEQFRRGVHADEDLDGVGEYGTLAEMGGRIGVRGLSAKVPRDLTTGMSMVDVAGEVQRDGFVFRVYLPLADGRGMRERPYGGMPAGVVDADLAESHWACYAWPTTNGITGTRTFFLNDRGEVLTCEEGDRSGQNSAYVRAGDAFHTDDPDRMTDEPAAGTTGSDGHVWMPLD